MVASIVPLHLDITEENPSFQPPRSTAVVVNCHAYNDA
jgi:hypothetical protein